MNNSTESPSEAGSFERLETGPAISLIVVINACSSLAASVWNFLIILTFVKKPSLRTPSYILILGLAITDFGVGALVQPAFCVELFARMKAYKSLVDASYLIRSVVAWVLSFSSFLTMTAITIDRFLALHFVLRYQQLVTTKRSCVVLIMIGILGLSSVVTKWFAIAEVVYVSIGVALVILNIVLVLMISRAIRKRSAIIHAQEQSEQATLNLTRYKKTVNTMYYIMGTMVVCYIPYTVKSILWGTTGVYSRFAYHTTSTLVFVNGSLNPVIYCWRIQDIRNAVVQLVRSIRCQQHEQ